MTISPLALQAKRVIEAAWLHGPAFDLASQAAFALESAQLLQSPETAAEGALSADAVRVAEESVTELRLEHEENARLREALRKACDEVARLESELGGATARAAELDGLHKQAVLRGMKTSDRARALQARIAELEDPHDSPLHHRYLKGRDLDLPELGGAR